MKILFLDIDGCLNSKRTETAYGKDRTIENLDPIAIGLIQEVVNETGCLICLSSDWRLSHDFMKLGKQLDLPIIFETNHDEEVEFSVCFDFSLSGLESTNYNG